MRVIFLGDIVGRAAREKVVNKLPSIKKDHDIDFAIVNGCLLYTSDAADD